MQDSTDTNRLSVQYSQVQLLLLGLLPSTEGGAISVIRDREFGKSGPWRRKQSLHRRGSLLESLTNDALYY